MERSDPVEPICTTIVNYLMKCDTNETYVDFVAVANQGADFSSHLDKRYLGSVANGIIRKSNLNVLFIA